MVIKRVVTLTALVALGAFAGNAVYLASSQGLVTQKVPAPQSEAVNRLYYSRSTDGAASFSQWRIISGEAGGDAAIAVSEEGKIAIAWVAPLPVGNSGRFATHGNVRYVESTDGGETWSNEIEVTDGFYAEETPNSPDTFTLGAIKGSIDCAYDRAGNLHIGWGDAWRGAYVSGDTLYYRYFRRWFQRMMHYSEVTNDFYIVSSMGEHAPYTQFIPYDNEGNVIEWLDIGFWGLGFDVDGYTCPGLGCWNPQLAAIGPDDDMVYTWTGQWDSLDITAAGTINADIYAAITTDGGNTWGTVANWDSVDIANNGSWLFAHITNMTDTHSPGAKIGESLSEEYHSVWPWIGSDSILHITYIHDLFAGSCLHAPIEGIYTENPVMYLGRKVYEGKGPPIPGVRETLSPTTSAYLTEGYQAGITTHDYQSNGAMGNRIAVDSDGDVHVAWMQSEEKSPPFSDRSIYYNVWKKSSGDFIWPSGVKASGTAKAGYTTMALLSDGRAVVAFHHDPDGDGTYCAAVTADISPKLGAFSPPVNIDPVTVPEQPICPKIVTDQDDVIHVIAYVPGPDPVADPANRIPAINETPDAKPAIIEVIGQHPAAGFVTFSINAPFTQASLKIYDATGNLAETLFEGKPGDTQVITWDTKNTSAGVYFYYFVTPVGTENGKIIVVQ
jgi:hypothetical protein